MRVDVKSVTPENRFALVNGGEVDLECGSSTNNTERRKSNAFSPTIFVTGTKRMVAAAAASSLFAIWRARPCVRRAAPCTRPRSCSRSGKSSTSVRVRRRSQRIVPDARGAQGGRAFANDDVQLYGNAAKTGSGSEFRVVGDFPTYADYALMFRKDDPEFAEVVERAFHRLAGSREITGGRRAVVPEAVALGSGSICR